MPIDFNAAKGVELHPDINLRDKVYGPPPAIVDPFDIEAAKAELSVYKEKLEEMLAEARAFKITDEASNNSAVQMGLQAKKLGKRIKDTGAEKTKKHRLFTGGVRNLVKVHTDITDEIEGVLKGKFRGYSSMKEMKRREAERKAQEAADKLQAKINREAKEKKIEPVQVPVPALPQKPAPTRTEEGSASIKKVWVWKLIDKARVPDEYKELDAVAINKAIRGAVRNIPGIEIFQEEKTVFRG